MTYHAEIIAVGTELLLGNIANTDAQMLSKGRRSCRRRWPPWAWMCCTTPWWATTPNGWRKR